MGAGPVRRKEGVGAVAAAVKRRGVDGALVLTLLLAVFGVGAVVALPRDGRPMLVALPTERPASALLETLARADALLVAVGAVPGLYVVSSERPGLAARLWQVGAVFVVDAALAVGCRPVNAQGVRL
jgi:hypothetical protein